MRSFNYNFDGREVTIAVSTESGDHICNAKFPTLAGSKKYFEHDINLHFLATSQPPLTEEETAYLKNLVESQN
jgi:hypothetical protein